MKSFHLIGVAVMATALLNSCSIMKNNKPAEAPADTAKPSAVPVAPVPDVSAQQTKALLGEWSITEANGTKIIVNGENHPKLTLGAVSGQPDILRVIGFNGCNHINGDWKIDGSKIIPSGNFISTMRACPDAPYELTVNQALNSVASYRLEANDLVLYSAAGTPVMILRSRNLSFLNGAWRVTAIHGNPLPATAKVKIVVDIDECKVHGNTGCNVLNGEIVVNLDKGDGLEFKNLAVTRMLCPDIATEQDFLLALEEVDTAVRGGDDSEALLKDTQGNTVIAMSRLSADQLADE